MSNAYPEDLKECVYALNRMMDVNYKSLYKQMEEKEFIVAQHHGLGRWIRNSWRLWVETSKLSKFFNILEIKHPDDMSTIILAAFHRFLNKRKINLEELTNQYKSIVPDEKPKVVKNSGESKC